MRAPLTPHQLTAVELLQRAKEYADNSKAANSTRTYASLWTDFLRFAETMHASPLPAQPALVVAYLTALAPRQAIATLKSKLAAIRYYHVQSHVPDPTRDTIVKDVLEGIRREHGKPQTRKAAMDHEVLRAMLRVQPKTLRGVRNRAMLLLAYACELRRSEVTALLAEDVDLRNDRMIVTLRESKTDQVGEGYQFHVPRIPEKNLCAAFTVETWMRIANVEAGPLFREVDRWEHVGEVALTPQVFKDIIKEAAKLAHLDARKFGGHSGRRGGITQAGRNHESTGDIRKVSRHHSERMLDIYREDTAEAQMRVIANVLRGKAAE